MPQPQLVMHLMSDDGRRRLGAGRRAVFRFTAGEAMQTEDDDEGRGTPRDTTEGLDQHTCRSDHSDPYHTRQPMCGGSNPLSHPASGMARHSNPQAGVRTASGSHS